MESSTHIPPDGAAPSTPAESLDRGHEQRDVSLRAVIWFVVILAASVVVTQLGVWALMRIFEHHNRAQEAPASPFAAEHQPPPEPRLQPSLDHNALPYQDMDRLRDRWQHELTNYARVPGQPERASIPIDRAMQIFIERGLPAATSRPATTQMRGTK